MIATLFATLTVLLPAAAVESTPEPLPLELALDLPYVTSAIVAPDGSKVAYTVSVPRSADEGPGGRHSELWIQPASGGAPTLFIGAKSSAGSPAFTPDGRSLAFLRKGDDGNTQVFEMPLDGGEAVQVTRAPRSIGSFQHSPDGALIAFTMTDGETDAEKKAKKEGRDETVVGESWKFTRLHMWDVAASASRLVSAADVQVWSYDWYPAGDRLVAKVSDTTLTDHQYMFTRIVQFDAAGSDPRPLFDTAGKLGEPKVSPDGRHIAWTGATSLHDPYAGSVFVGPADGGPARNLTGDFEGTAEWLGWTADGRIATVTYERQATALRTMGVDGSHASSQVQWKGEQVFRSASLGGDRFAFAASTPTRHLELFVGALDREAAPERRTNLSVALDDVALGEQEIYRWTSRDGLELEGVLVKPVGFRENGRYPLVLNIHGGPEGVVTNGWNTSYGYWSQFLATRGYVVLLPNYRASIGRGVAFSMADHRDLGGMEFTDVIDAIDALAAQGVVDPERVGIGGGSYGGYFSMWAATRHTKRFRAAVGFAGISNWISMLGTSDIPEENLLVHWNLPAEGNLLQFLERSPIYFAERSETALMLVHGERDLRVPIQQSTEMYTLMKVLGKDVTYVTYPREPHGIRERAHQIDYVSRVIALFDEHVKGAAAAEAPTSGLSPQVVEELKQLGYRR